MSQITADELAHRIFEDEPVSEQERLDYKDEDEDESYYDNEDYEPTNPVSDEEWARAVTPRSEQPIFYVYVYIDPTKRAKKRYSVFNFTHEPFYVGKGHGERSHSHLKAVLNGLASDGYLDEDEMSSSHKKRRIAKILRTGKEPIIRLLAVDMREQPSFSLEVLMIAKIGRRDKKTGPLTNLTDGGEGCSEESLRKRAATMSRRTPEQVREHHTNISLGLQRIPHEVKEDISNRKREIEANRTEDERKVISNKIKKALSDRPEEEKQAAISKMLEKFYARTPEEQACISDGTKTTWKNRTEEQRSASRLKRRIKFEARTEEEQHIISEKIRIKKESRTPEEKQASLEKWRASMKIIRARKNAEKEK